MPTPATHVWKPSNARTVVLDSFIPVPRGSTAVAPPPLNWPTKDPADVLDFQFDISPALIGNDGDAIATLDVTIEPANPGDLTLNSATADGAVAVLWLSGGQPGIIYTGEPDHHHGEWPNHQSEHPLARALSVRPAGSA